MKRSKLLIVDGYNLLNAREGALEGTLADARDRLTALLEDYAGYSGQKVVLVFDAWLSDRLQRTSEEKGPLTIVYTRKGETADHYIERMCESYAHDVEVGRLSIRVATSDGLEQTVVLGRGAERLSAREMWRELNESRAQARQTAQERAGASKKMPLIDRLPGEIRAKLEEMRRAGGRGE